jgi:hypothetical protein
MTVEEFLTANKEFLVANKDDEKLKTFITEIAPAPVLTDELVAPYLETPEGLKLIQPYGDRRANEAVKTHDEKTAAKNKIELDKRIAQEILKLHPEDTPEQKRLKEIELKLAENEKVMAQKELSSLISAKAHEMNVDPMFVASMNFQSVDESVVWMKRVLDRDEQIKKKVANELTAAGAKPGSGNPKDGKGPMTAKEYAALPFAERIKLQESGEAAKITQVQ